MSASDPYFRFPLSALALSRTPVEILRGIASYSVVSAGLGAGQKGTVHEVGSAHLLAPRPESREEHEWWLTVCAGAHITQVELLDWRKTLHCYQETRSETDALGLKSALVTINARWVMNALHTALQEEGQKDWDPYQGWMTWREFRVLCAILSVIGAKSYAWASTATLMHRACGYTSAASMRGKEPTAACPLLTRRVLETTLHRLELNRFFLRCRISRNPCGKGGRTAYSVRHADRQALITHLRKAKPQFSNRQEDHALWTQSSA